MTDNIHMIKNLSTTDLIKDETGDIYTVMRNGHDFGAFIKVGETYRFRDNQHKTWVCQCTDIDTGATSIEDAVAFMSY
jgi:uncharacterized surface anchored protein